MAEKQQTVGDDTAGEPMKVSVIVSMYNEADILPRTLAPLLAQDYPDHLTEIILVDDASADDTSRLLEDQKWKARCEIIRHRENRGRSATRNSGIKAATGEILIFLDCDIEVQPQFVAQHVALHKNRKVIGVVSNLQTRYSHLKDKYHRYIFQGRRGAKLIGDNKPLPFRYFIMTCSSIKADAVKRTGMFNEKLPGYGIDLEYAYRLWKNYPEGLFYSSHIVVFMHKVKTLEEALANFTDFGQRNLPIILNDYPDLAPYVGAEWVANPQGRLSVKNLVGRLFINKFTLNIARLKVQFLPYPLSNPFIRYLLVASTAMGYRDYLRNRE